MNSMNHETLLLHDRWIPHEWMHVDPVNNQVLLPDDSFVHLSRDQMRIFVSLGETSKPLDVVAKQVNAMRLLDEAQNIDTRPYNFATARIIRSQITLINDCFHFRVITGGFVENQYKIIPKALWHQKI